MTIDKLKESQSEYQKLATYYKNIDFPLLSKHFQNMANMCDEMQSVMVEYNTLKEKINEQQEMQ
jgi:hypothetical protein